MMHCTSRIEVIQSFKTIKKNTVEGRQQHSAPCCCVPDASVKFLEHRFQTAIREMMHRHGRQDGTLTLSYQFQLLQAGKATYTVVSNSVVSAQMKVSNTFA